MVNSLADLLTPRHPTLQLMRQKTDFVSSVTHELRTPLNAIIGLSRGILSGCTGALSDQQVRDPPASLVGVALGSPPCALSWPPEAKTPWG